MSRFGFIASFLLHLFLFVLILSQVGFRKKPFSLNPKAIPLRVLPIKDKTRLPSKKKKVVKKKVKIPKKKKPQTPPKKPVKKKSPAKKVTKPVVKKAEKKKKDSKKVVPKKPKKALEKPEIKQKKVEKSVEKEKIPDKKAPPVDDFLSVIKSIEDLPETEEDKKPEDEKKGTEDLKPIEDLLSLSELDALRQQISSCWRLPAGVRGAGDLIIKLRVTMNPDQTVQSVHLENGRTDQSDPYFQVAYESAKRALFHPKCVPLKVPKGKYAQWQQFSILFNPKEMII